MPNFPLPDLPFGGPAQMEPGFINGMQQSLASPFNPAPNPLPLPQGPIAPTAQESPPQAPQPSPPLPSTPEGKGWLKGMQENLPMIAAFVTSMNPQMSHMSPLLMQLGQMQRKERGAQVGAQMLMQVQEAEGTGDVGLLKQAITQAAGKIEPEQMPILQKSMERLTKLQDSQDFTKTLIPSMQMMSTGRREPVMAFLQGAQKANMDPKLIMQTLNEQFKLTPHFENGQLFMFEPSGGLTPEGPQALPQIAKSSEFEKYSKALQTAGYESPAQFANLLNIHDPQAMTDALRLGQLQNMIDQKEATDLEQKKTNIQVAGQIKASGARIGMEEASQKRMVMFRNLNAVPS